jgi:hypothetical protein
MTDESDRSPATNGATSDGSAADGAPSDPAAANRQPRLTIGQRVLTLLPDLQRRRSTGTDSSQGAADESKTRSSAKSTASPARRSASPAPRAKSDTSSRAADGRDHEPNDDQEVAEPAPTRRRASSSPARSGTRPADQFAGWSRQELTTSMKYLDERERRFALMAGPFLAALDLVLTLITLHNNPPALLHGRPNKLHADPTTIVALGVGSAVIALGVMGCALIRRRSLTIFALLFAGYGGGLVTIIPSWVLAGWLYVRFNRMNKALRQRDGGARGRQTGRRVPADPRAAARAGASSARERAQSPRRNRKEPVPAGPDASKRYTPPKPTRPRPPASPT